MKNWKICIALLLTLLLLAGCGAGGKTQTQTAQPETQAQGALEVSFLDVGQGDGILICTPGGKTMLIDCGEKDQYEVIENALSSRNIFRIDVLVASHPHSDHIGCMAQVVENFEIGSIYMPKATSNTKTFENLLDAAEEKGLSIHTAKAGKTIDLEEDLAIRIVGPTRDYEDLNDVSAVLHLTYGETSFLFTGDAEVPAEEDILASGADIRADVLKVGHHGSSTSTCEEFLRAVDPAYGVIQCGQGNDYGHPHKETLEALAGLAVYRTDEMGEIRAFSDGKTIRFETRAGTQPVIEETKETEDAQYIGNKNSKKYHAQDCSSLPKPENRVIFESKAAAEEAGFGPCGQCRP